MLIIPAINCKDFKCVKEQLEKAAEFLPRAASKRWVQIDVSDGKFTKAKSWNNAAQLHNLQLITNNLQLNLEIHLMVNNLKPNVLKWLPVADRIIFHFENLSEKEFEFIKEVSQKNKKVKFGIAITTKTPVEMIVPFISENVRMGQCSVRKSPRLCELVQLLAVKPGYSGGKFDAKTLDKIKFLKKNHPKVLVEVDGGMNDKTAKLVKKAGADIIISGSYIFSSKNPKEAYEKLSRV